MSFGLASIRSLEKRPLPPSSVIFGRTRAMAAVQQQIEKVGSANVPVLSQGESGTGKEIIAKLIHESSEWKNGPFIIINYPAVPGTLIESELLVYAIAAFTVVSGTTPGR